MKPPLSTSAVRVATCTHATSMDPEPGGGATRSQRGYASRDGLFRMRLHAAALFKIGNVDHVSPFAVGFVFEHTRRGGC